MRRKILTGALAALIVGAWTISSLPAQQPTRERPQRVLLIDQIDQLGRTIFGGILSPFQQDANRGPSVAPEERPARYANRPNLVHVQRSQPTPPASERLAERVSPQGTSTSRPNLWDQIVGEKIDPDDSSRTAPNDSRENPYANAYPPEVKSPSLGRSRTAVSARTVVTDAQRDATPGTAEISSEKKSSDGPEHEYEADSTSGRLHERLAALRISPFEESPSEEVAADVPSAEVELGEATAGNDSPQEAVEPDPAPAATPRPHLAADRIPAESPQPAISEPSVEPMPVAEEEPGEEPSPEEEPGEVALPRVLAGAPPMRRPTLAPHVGPAQDEAEVHNNAAARPAPAASVADAPASVAPKRIVMPPAEKSAEPAPPEEQATPEEQTSPEEQAPLEESAPSEEMIVESEPERIAEEDVLITRQSPILDVRTIGPRRITVGKPSVFVVNISNSGLVAANDAVVTIDLPEWTDVVGTEATVGTAGWVQSAGVSKQFQWTVGRLDAKGKEQLTLSVVPRKSQPFDLAVRWDYKPVATQTLIEVQEPMLEMRLDGPREILYGAKQVYRLELSNSGTGDAENVEISLMPIGVSHRTPATHKLGTLPAGERKAVEVELTARQNGEVTVEVEARGDAGAKARLVETIVVVRPSLEVEVEAPPMQYAGAVARYLIRVKNPGTAAARNVRISAAIPAGARHELSTPTGSLTSDGREVSWKVDSIAPGDEKGFTLHCKLDEAGTRLLSVHTSADNDLTAMADARTLVETMPDLALAVKDPVGPIPVGAEATYQVAIQNRGTETAEDVEVVAYFSRGIEPTSAEGAEYRISPGQVVFQKIGSLGIGKGVSLLVHARAETAGNHVFRVEVYCKASGIRLVSEEMTHYYSGSDGPQQATQDNASSEPRYLRTAERYSDESSQ